MLQEVFNRDQKKYLLTEDGLETVHAGCRRGRFSRINTNSMGFSSIYFDSPDCGLIPSGLEKPVYKKKK